MIFANWKAIRDEEKYEHSMTIFDEIAQKLFKMTAVDYNKLDEDGQDALFYEHFDKMYNVEVLVSKSTTRYPKFTISKMILVEEKNN